MNKCFAIKGVDCVIIDGIRFDTINSVKIYKKGNKLYMNVHNEVLDDYRFNKFYDMIKDVIKNPYVKYDVTIRTKTYDDSSKCIIKSFDYTCEVPDGDLFEMDQTEISNLGFTFEIKDI